MIDISIVLSRSNGESFRERKKRLQSYFFNALQRTYSKVQDVRVMKSGCDPFGCIVRYHDEEIIAICEDIDYQDGPYVIRENDRLFMMNLKLRIGDSVPNIEKSMRYVLFDLLFGIFSLGRSSEDSSSYYLDRLIVRGVYIRLPSTFHIPVDTVREQFMNALIS